MTKNLISGAFWPVWHTFGPPKFLSMVLPLRDVRHCRKLSFYAISRKTYDPNSFSAWFEPFWPKFGSLILFKKIWPYQSLDIMISDHHVQYQKNLMIQSWENLVTDGGTDGRTDRRTDRRELFHRTLSNWCRASNIITEGK